MQGSSVLAGMALAAVAATAGAVIVDRASGPDGTDVATLSAQRAAQAQESNRKALANVNHALHVAQRARRVARRGRGKARTALATARALVDDVQRALADASNALTRSGDALSVANDVNDRLSSTEVFSRTENGTVSTSEENDYVSLGGPSVTVNVPSSGLVEVWANVRFEDDGAVALYEDGQRVPIPGQEGICTDGGPLDDALISSEGLSPITLSTPPATVGVGFGCGAAGGAPGSILLDRSRGTHTYELRYGDVCGCSPAEFSNRTLRVGPRL